MIIELLIAIVKHQNITHLNPAFGNESHDLE